MAPKAQDRALWVQVEAQRTPEPMENLAVQILAFGAGAAQELREAPRVDVLGAGRRDVILAEAQVERIISGLEALMLAARAMGL